MGLADLLLDRGLVGGVAALAVARLDRAVEVDLEAGPAVFGAAGVAVGEAAAVGLPTEGVGVGEVDLPAARLGVLARLGRELAVAGSLGEDGQWAALEGSAAGPGQGGLGLRGLGLQGLGLRRLRCRRAIGRLLTYNRFVTAWVFVRGAEAAPDLVSSLAASQANTAHTRLTGTTAFHMQQSYHATSGRGPYARLGPQNALAV